MTEQTETEATQPVNEAELWHRIAKAIHRYDHEHDLSRNDIPSKHHKGEASAVLAALQPELNRLCVLLARLEPLEDRQHLETLLQGDGNTVQLLAQSAWKERDRALAAEDRVHALEAEVAAARKYAAEMRDFASPHGVSVHYADQLEAAMDRAKEGRA